MNAEQLRQRLASQPPPALVHVLPEEVFAAKRIPQSCNACVYEMSFLETMASLAPDKASPVIVYGAGEGSHDAEVAKEKLLAAGYANVEVFADGLSGWEHAGLPCEGKGLLPAEPRVSGTFEVDTKESVARWTGRNLFNHHNGTVKLNSGRIVIKDSALVSAQFTIDMRSIACEDLTDSTWNAMLIRHLQDADFFDVGNHPQAIFIAKRAERLDARTEGTPNFVLHGQFTLRGITRPLSFPVVIAAADGQRITGQAQFELDRTQFGSIYGSGRFFRFLGKHVVNDHIHLHVKLHADRISAV